jgi:hypothetical protein
VLQATIVNFFLLVARRAAVLPWKQKVVEHRMSTSEAALSFTNASFDFIYVDARHDYCGVAEASLSSACLADVSAAVTSHPAVLLYQQFVAT